MTNKRKKETIQDIKVVIGANYGDEGKGLMTDYFCSEAGKKGNTCIVVCTNGGAQRGHTVTTPEGIRHIFRHFGSGTFAGADTFLGGAYLVNPVIFREEWEELAALGYRPKVYAVPSCRWTTPYDMMANQMIEEFRAGKRHGSCGLGIWETVLRGRRNVGTRPLFACSETEIREILRILREEYFPARLAEAGIGTLDEQWKELFCSRQLEENFLEDVRFFKSIVIPAENDVLLSYDQAVFENGQGLLLDMGIREHLDHTTPSHTGLFEVARILETMPVPMETEVCYVSRTYLTRHGAGPMENECPKAEINETMHDLTNVPNPFQGTLRYGILDPEKLRQRIMADLASEQKDLPGRSWKCTLALTHLNETDGRVPGTGFKTMEELPAEQRPDYTSWDETRKGVKKGGIR